jgi:beta-glucosidase-like glycosyl hydrolase
MVPFAYTEFIDELTSQVKNNIIPMSRIDDAVYRILRVKFTMGLFENPYADPSLVGELGKQVSSEQHTFLLSDFIPKNIELLL